MTPGTMHFTAAWVVLEQRCPGSITLMVRCGGCSGVWLLDMLGCTSFGDMVSVWSQDRVCAAAACVLNEKISHGVLWRIF